LIAASFEFRGLARYSMWFLPRRSVGICCRRSRSTIQAHKERLAQLVREHLGEDILVQLQGSPRWTDNIAANREKVACRYERQTA